MGAAARDGRVIRRSADLRFAQLDHVLAPGVLLLRAPQAELPRSLCVPGSPVQSSSSATHPSTVEVEICPYHSDQAPRRGRTAYYRLVAGSLRTVRGARRKEGVKTRRFQATTCPQQKLEGLETRQR